MFCIEVAWWHYEDVVRNLPENKGKLATMSLKQFAALVLETCPGLQALHKSFDDVWNAFIRYKLEVPVRGVIALNPERTSCLMVRGWNKGGWSFPRGKLAASETDVECAEREVMEETGLDLRGRIDPKDSIRIYREERMAVAGEQQSAGNGADAKAKGKGKGKDKEGGGGAAKAPGAGAGSAAGAAAPAVTVRREITLYIVDGIPEDITVAPTCRYEIGAFAWHPVDQLPRTKEEARGGLVDANGKTMRYFEVLPFVKPLLAWIAKKNAQEAKTGKKAAKKTKAQGAAQGATQGPGAAAQGATLDSSSAGLGLLEPGSAAGLGFASIDGFEPLSASAFPSRAGDGDLGALRPSDSLASFATSANVTYINPDAPSSSSLFASEVPSSSGVAGGLGLGLGLGQGGRRLPPHLRPQPTAAAAAEAAPAAPFDAPFPGDEPTSPVAGAPGEPLAPIGRREESSLLSESLSSLLGSPDPKDKGGRRSAGSARRAADAGEVAGAPAGISIPHVEAFSPRAQPPAPLRSLASQPAPALASLASHPIPSLPPRSSLPPHLRPPLSVAALGLTPEEPRTARSGSTGALLRPSSGSFDAASLSSLPRPAPLPEPPSIAALGMSPPRRLASGSGLERLGSGPHAPAAASLAPLGLGSALVSAGARPGAASALQDFSFDLDAILRSFDDAIEVPTYALPQGLAV